MTQSLLAVHVPSAKTAAAGEYTSRMKDVAEKRFMLIILFVVAVVNDDDDVDVVVVDC